jgi:hypothetical protein
MKTDSSEGNMINTISFTLKDKVHDDDPGNLDYIKQVPEPYMEDKKPN